MSQRFQDIERFSGKKAVLAIMAADRQHPELMRAHRLLAELAHEDDLVIVTEHQPGSPLHQRFHCKPWGFCYALVDKDGFALVRGERIPTLAMLRRRLELESVDYGSI